MDWSTFNIVLAKQIPSYYQRFLDSKCRPSLERYSLSQNVMCGSTDVKVSGKSSTIPSSMVCAFYVAWRVYTDQMLQLK